MKKVLVNSIEQNVKFSEVDALGIVWHGHYVRYFEDGREAFGREFNLGYLDVFSKGYATPIVSIQCDYKKFLRYNDRVIIETTYVPCDPAKINFNYRLLNAATRELVVTGSTVQVFIDRNNFNLQLINPDFFFDWKRNHGLI